MYPRAKSFTRPERIDKTESRVSVLNTHLPDKTDFAGSVVMDFRAFDKN